MLKHRWTEKEIKIVTAEVKKTPNNLQSAFRRSSPLIGIPVKAISNAWYYHLKKEHSAFSIYTDNAKFPTNCKNTMEPKKPIHQHTTTTHQDGLRIVTIKQFYIV
jgi:hypothetical protein